MPRSRSPRRARSGNPLRDLLTSAKSGNPETIQHKSSKMGMDLNSVYSCGNTLLTKAIVDNEAPSTVEAIIKAGADVDYPNSQGKTALMMAVKARRPDLLTVLIQYGDDPKLKTPKRISAISLCFEGKLYSYLEILLRQSMNNVDSMIEHLEEICFFMRLTNNNFKETNKSDFVSPISNMDPRLISSIKNVYDLNLKDMNGSTSLMCAVSCHYDDCVRLLLVAGADVNRINKSKETALTLAMSRSHNPILKDLIRAGALRRHPRGETSTLNFGIFKMILDYLQQHGLFNMLDIYGKTALMYAAERGDKTCIMYAVQIDIEEFIKAKDKSAQCVSDDYDAESVLSTCAANETERNCKKSDEQLMEDVRKYQDNNGTPIIMYAFETGKMLLDSYIQSRVSGSVEYRDADGRTILMNFFKFYYQNSFSKVPQLILNIAQKNTPKCSSSNMSAFQVTYNTIERLFDGKANLRDKSGDSTVIYALRYCDFLTEEITKLLVGETHKQQYQDGKTALMIAVSGYNGGSHMYIEPLIGDSCSIHDKDGKTALMYAFMNKKLVPDDLLKQLIGDSQNVQDIDGKTALMYAFIHKKQLSEEMIELLAGETPFIQDKFGKTALMYALKYRKYLTDKSILKLFGGKVDICDNEGNTTLIYALNSHLNLSEEIISLLVGNRTQEKYQNGQTALMIALQLCNANRKKYRHDHFRNVYTTFSDWEMHWPMNRRRGYFSHQIEGEMSCQHYPEYIARRYLKPLVGDSCRVQDNDGKTALMHAFENTDLVPVDIVKQMIDGSQNLQDKDGKTALIYAFIHKKQVSDEMIELLAGETPFIQDNAGKTALMYAFEYQRYLTSSKIQTLFESKVDIRDNEGNTTLIYALKYGKNLTEEIISLLFGDRVTEKYQNCKTALMIALEFHDTNLQNYHLNRILSLHPSSNREITFFEKFIEGNCSQVNDVMTTPYQSIYIEDHYLKPLIKDSCSIQDNEGKTALMYALIKTKNISENVLLMMIGDSRNIQDIQGRTALMYAFIHKKQLSEELICHLAGETPCMQDNAGKTALMYAFECNQCLTYSSILKLFGGKVNICDNKGKTHLMYALQFYTHMNEEIANLLVGDTHKVQYQHGKTALMIALEHNKNLKSIHHFIQSLIDCSCDVLDSSGRTALMYAMRHSAQLPEHLFEQMIRESQFIQDNEGKTALMYAFQKNHFSNYMILNLFHSDLRNVQDHQGKTALHHAIIHDQTEECIKELILHGSNLEAEDKQKRTPLVLCLELDMLYHASPWMENFLNTKMILKYNPMLRLNLLGKIILLKTIQKELFSLNKLSKNKDIFRLIIVNGIEPFPHLNENMSTFFAILKENMIDVVKYLIANMYLTNEDVMLLRKAKDYLKSNEYQRKHKMLFNGTYLDLRSPHLQHLITEATSQPWPLVKLSFIVVSSAVGHGTNREDRVNRLPLPNPIKDSLMFNTRTALIPVSEWTNIPMVFDPVEYENTRRPRPLLNFWPFGAELVV